MTRRLIAAALVALAAVPATPASAAGLRISSVDTSRFPTVTAVVQAPSQPQRVQLRENGQPVATLIPGAAQPPAIALAIDTSRSMAGQPLDDAISAASAFVARQRAGSPLAVYAFGSRAAQAAPFAPDRTGAASALHQLAVDDATGTAIYAAVVRVAHDFTGVDAGRRILVLLTDGRSLADSATLDEAISAARAAHVAVYPLAIGGVDASLQRLADATGGETSNARSSAGLQATYDALGARISGRLVLSYRSTASAGTALHLQASAPGMGAAEASAEAPGRAEARAASSGTGHGLLAVGIGLIVALAALVLLSARPDVIVKRRIEPYVAKRSREEVEADIAEEIRMSPLQQLFVATESVAGRLNAWKRISARLEQADMPMRTAEVLYIQLACSLVVLVLLRLFLHAPGLVALGAGLAGFTVPALVVRTKAKRRLARFEAQLPETLITMAASLKAGHSFNQAVQSIANEGIDPTSREYARVVAEIQLGEPPEIALESMARRMDSANFGFVVTAVNIQRTVGGSLAEILDMVADTVRQREQFGRKVKALTAQGRISAYVLTGMPFVMALAIWFINPPYMELLWGSSIGRIMIGFGLVMMGIGSIVIRKIVSFRG